MDCSRPKTRNPEEWMEYTPEFSRPMAEQVREWFVRWEPDLSEAIKWNILCFSGRKLVCGISACKAHLGIAFFRGMELDDRAKLFSGGENNTNIQSIRVTSLEKLDTGALRALLRAAVVLDSSDLPPPPPKKRTAWPMPDFFKKALSKDRAASAGFASLAPTYQREYIISLTVAKRPETRERRLRETILALQKGRKWMDRKKRDK